MSRADSWTPLSYPVQSPPPAAPAPTSSAGAVPKPKIPRVPRDLRALQDGTAPPLPGRTIIVCLDGTGDKFDGDNSNIVHLVSCFKKSDRNQVIYYQSGIGTYDSKGMSKGFHAAVDMAIGSGLGTHIRDAYSFLMQNYKENDRICLFGFSRGAYTARCLAGMIHKVGLLPAHNQSQIQFAYQYYKMDTPEGWRMSGEFKRTFCTDVSVHFIGGFDSVASVGFIPRRLPLSSTPTNKARYFRHAMALDEHRAKFKVCRFRVKDHTEPGSHWEIKADLHEDATLDYDGPAAALHAKQSDETLTKDKETEKAKKDVKETDVLEVWFTGCHADVGGGAVKNEERHKLSQIPLRWMIRQCFACDTGIVFKTHALAEEGLDVHTLWPAYTPLQRPKVGPPPSLLAQFEDGGLAPIARRASVLKPADPHGLHAVQLFDDARPTALHAAWVPEQAEDYFDALAPLNDQLVQAKGWWVLEGWPIKVRVQPADSDRWVKRVRMNMGRFRPVQDLAPHLHWTVLQRMEAQDYRIRVRMDRQADWNVVV